MASKWVALERDFAGERKLYEVARQETATDPLRKVSKILETATKPTTAATSSSSTATSVVTSGISAVISDPLSSSAKFIDPLSAALSDPLSASSVIVDPLTAAASSPGPTTAASSSSSGPASTAAAASSSNNNLNANMEEEFVAEKFVSWSQRKTQIVQKFTTSAQISVPSFASSDLQKSAKAANTSKSRLEQLDDDKDFQTTVLRYSQKEYIQHMEDLNQELARAWEKEERVKALKMAIQCAKLLGDNSLPHFYPSMFVLITEILDTFGKLVFERIKKKGLANPAAASKQAHEFVPSDVTEEARETCRNWFFKIASIRELLPRLYVEMAIMRCYQFLVDRSEFLKIFPRMASMIRGLGDPLAATYARCYLARRGWEIMPELKTYLHNGWNDFTFTFKDIYTEFWKKKISTEYQLTINDYVELLQPGLSWTLQCLAHKSEQDTFRSVLADYATCGQNSPMLLHTILSCFSSQLISSHAPNITPLIREVEVGTTTKTQLYEQLGRCMVEYPPPKTQQLQLLNEVWKYVTKLEDPAQYMIVSVVYIEFVIKYFSDKEVNVLIRDLVRHLQPNRAYIHQQDPLEILGLHMIRSMDNFGRMIAMDQFMPFLDLYVGRSKVQICKALLEIFDNSPDVTTDPVLIHAAFDMAKTLHDSVDSLSFQDEVRQISKLICNFVRKIYFGNDLEQHLNFFVDCRRFFVNIDAIKDTLVMGVCSLVMKTNKIVNGQHTKRTTNFVKACLAFCHITIPSIENRMLRLNLFLLCGQISLVNNTLAQADTFFKTSITLIPDIPTCNNPPTESEMVQFLNNFASTLVIVPGHPDLGPFYLIKGLLNVVKDYPWDSASGNRVKVYLNMLVLFSMLSQSQLPYHIDRDLIKNGGAGSSSVESNDVLFACEGSYMDELQALIDKLVEETLSELVALKQPSLALELVNRLVACSKLNPPAAALVYDMYSMAKKISSSKEDQTFFKNTTAFLAKKASSNGKLYQELFRRLQSV